MLTALPHVRFTAAAAAALLGAAAGLGGGDARAEEPSLVETMTALLAARAADGRASLESGLAGLEPIWQGVGASTVAALIVSSRDDAVARGVERIPEPIRAEIGDYVPREVLDTVRWCAQCGGALSLQRGTFRLGIAPAITLDHVIVFAEREAALSDPALWIHEFKHVMQFAEWGVEGFAARYVEDYSAVEHEAAEFRWEWVQRTGWLERRKDRPPMSSE